MGDENPRSALKSFKANDEIEGVILSSDLERERVTISIKHLEENDYRKITEKLMKAEVVTCRVTEVIKDGLYVEAPEGVKGFVRKFDLSKHKDQQKPERFTVGDKIDAKMISFDKYRRISNFSVKILEIAD